MVTDPVQQIARHEHESPLRLDVSAALTRLAALPSSVAAPYVTVCLDWRPDGTNPANRPARRQFDEEADRLLAGLDAHSPAHDSVAPDIERIRTFLDEEMPAEAQGAYVVTCHARGVFEALPLGLPLPTQLHTAPTPSLGPLSRLADDHPTYAVLVADQRDATLYLIDQGTPRFDVEVEGTDFPRHQSQGGWSQKRYQTRADERIAHFATSVAEETRRTLSEIDAKALIIGGDEVITPALQNAFHQTVRARVVATIPIDIRSTPRQVIDATLPLAERAEREREAATIERLREAIGADAVMTALQTGQVMLLVLNDDFGSAGWADYTLPVYGAGEPPREHPAGGDVTNLVSIRLEAEAVRLAIQSDAEIEIVRTAVPVTARELEQVPDAASALPRAAAAIALDEMGGIGALLRFSLDDNQATANL